MNEVMQQKSDNKPETKPEIDTNAKKSPSPDEAFSKEPAGHDYFSRLFPYMAAVVGGDTPSERFSSLLTGPLMSHPVNRTPRNQTFMQMQQTFGNHYVQRMVERSRNISRAPGSMIQAKLTIGQPNDIYEQEADRIADQVMRMPEPGIHRKPKCPECIEEEQIRANPVTDRIMRIPNSGCPECMNMEEEGILQTKQVHGQVPTVTSNMESRIDCLKGNGQPLPQSTRFFFESRFGNDFQHVRVHTSVEASRIARRLNAEAFTRGDDIYFSEGRYQPNTNQGQRLMAHELAHTIQQGGTSPSGEAGTSGTSRESVTTGTMVTGMPVQRFEIPSVGEIIGGAEAVVNEAVETGERAVQSVVETVESGVEAVEQAVDWILTAAGQEALAAANALAGLFGGSVVIIGGCIVITIPKIPIFPTFQKTLGETPPLGFFIPLIGGGTMIGPFPVVGMAGILVYGQGSIESAIGPGVIRNIRIEICPFTSRYMATAQLYAAAAIGPRLTLFGGLFGAVGTAIPTAPPIPIILILQGGLRGTGTGWAIGAIEDTVQVEYSRGTLNFSNITDFMGGVLLQGDVDLFAALRLYDKIVCQYAYRLGHWETGRAWKLTLPIRATLSGGGGSGSVGPITYGPMPIKDIETAIRPLPTGWDCLNWAEIKQILCDNGVLPPDFCGKKGPGGVLPGPIPGVPPLGVAPPEPGPLGIGPQTSDEPCENPLPIRWPHDLPLPPEKPPLQRRGSGEFDGDDRGSEQKKLAKKIKEAREKGLPPPSPCFEDDAEPNQVYDAHHKQPMYLNGKDQSFNLCALENSRHINGHRDLDNQQDMADSDPIWLACGISEGRLKNHPKGQMYEIDGRK